MSEIPKYRLENTPKILDEARSVQKEVEQVEKEGKLEEAEKRIFQPLIEVDYRNQEKAEVVEGENKFNFSSVKFREFNEEDKKSLSDYLKDQEKTGLRGMATDPSSWYAADQLNYSFKEDSFDIFSLLPEGYKILFCPDSEKKTGAVIWKRKTIFIQGDLASIGSLAIILHEIGHVKDFEKLEQYGRDRLVEGGTMTQDDEAETLRREQEASYYALRKMWLYLRKNPQVKDDVILFLKNIAYFSYCDYSLKKVDREAIVNHDYDIDVDLKQYEEMDDWHEFKKSPGYEEWKKIDKFALLDEYEEFGEWCMWRDKLIETGEMHNKKEYYKKYFGDRYKDI